MARTSGQFKSSANAGQLSEKIYGKVNLKQYNSGAKRMLGFEPVMQSGFSLLPGSLFVGSAPAAPCVQTTLTVSSSSPIPSSSWLVRSRSGGKDPGESRGQLPCPKLRLRFCQISNFTAKPTRLAYSTSRFGPVADCFAKPAMTPFGLFQTGLYNFIPM